MHPRCCWVGLPEDNGHVSAPDVARKSPAVHWSIWLTLPWRSCGASLAQACRSRGASGRSDRAELAIARRQDYIARMDTAPRPGDRADTLSPETEAERQRRLAWEAEGIAEARADVAAGRLVDAAKVRAWVDSLRTDNPLPVPYSGR